MTIRSPFRPHYGSTQTVAPAAAAATITIGRGDKSIRVRNTGATNIGFFRVFRLSDGAVAATAADMPVAAGETVIIEKDTDYDSLSHISAAGTSFVITAGEGGA
jgi:hypothetical protein